MRVEEVKCPRGLEADGRAVLHNYETERGILNRVLIAIPRTESVALSLYGKLIELLVHGAYAVFGLIVVHHPKGKVERVRTDVDKGTAALLVLVQEHAPSGNTAATKSQCSCVIDIAEFAVFRRFMHTKSLSALAVLVTDGELFAGTLCRVYHLLRFFGVDSHRLLAKNVLARLESVDGDKAVRTVGGQNVNRLDLGDLEKLFVVRGNESVFNAVLFCRLLRSFLYDIAKSNELNVLALCQCGEVLAVGNTAATYNTDLNGSFTHICLPSLRKNLRTYRFHINYTTFRCEINSFFAFCNKIASFYFFCAKHFSISQIYILW